MRIVTALLTGAIVAFAATPSQAADSYPFTFNVHVRFDNIPPNAVSALLTCRVTPDAGESVQRSASFGIKGLQMVDRDVTVAIPLSADVDPRIYKTYTCTLLVGSTTSGGTTRMSRIGMTAPNDGVMEGKLPVQ